MGKGTRWLRKNLAHTNVQPCSTMFNLLPNFFPSNFSKNMLNKWPGADRDLPAGCLGDDGSRRCTWKNPQSSRLVHVGSGSMDRRIEDDWSLDMSGQLISANFRWFRQGKKREANRLRPPWSTCEVWAPRNVSSVAWKSVEWCRDPKVQVANLNTGLQSQFKPSKHHLSSSKPWESPCRPFI